MQVRPQGPPAERAGVEQHGAPEQQDLQGVGGAAHLAYFAVRVGFASLGHPGHPVQGPPVVGGHCGPVRAGAAGTAQRPERAQGLGRLARRLAGHDGRGDGGNGGAADQVEPHPGGFPRFDCTRCVDAQGVAAGQNEVESGAGADGG